MNIFAVPRDVFFGHIFIFLNDVDHALLMGTCRHFYAWLHPVYNGHHIILEKPDLMRVLFDNHTVTLPHPGNYNTVVEMIASILWANHGFNAYKSNFIQQLEFDYRSERFPTAFFYDDVFNKCMYRVLTDSAGNIYFCYEKHRDSGDFVVPEEAIDMFDRYFPGTFVYKSVLNWTDRRQKIFRGDHIFVLKVKRGNLPRGLNMAGQLEMAAAEKEGGETKRRRVNVPDEQLAFKEFLSFLMKSLK